MSNLIEFGLILFAVISIDHRIKETLKFKDNGLLIDVGLLCIFSIVLAYLNSETQNLVALIAVFVSVILGVGGVAPKLFNAIAVLVSSVIISTIAWYLFHPQNLILFFSCLLICFSFLIVKRSLIAVFFIILGCVFVVLNGLHFNTHTGIPTLVAFSIYLGTIWILYTYRLITYDVKKTEEEDY